MLKSSSLAAALVAFSISFGALADGPCKPKREAKKAAHEALHECIKAWAKDFKPTDTDPSDDCNAKLASFVTASKDVKACHVENEKKK